MVDEWLNEPVPCSWVIDDLEYAGLSWGGEDGIPVLCLHGWMDHAESFSELAPRLTGCRVVALDLSGQGLSAHRAKHATYNIWDDLPQIAGFLDQLGWQDCVLIGHSRGANIAGLFAAAQPDRVQALISLDSLVPEPSTARFSETLSAFVKETRERNARAPRIFPEQQDYIERRRAQGNAPEVSSALAARALQETPDGFVMRGDARMFASSAVKLKQEDIEDVLRSIRCPVLNIWASGGIKSKRPQIAATARLGQDLVATFEALEIPGDHHFHMAPRGAELTARAILDFFTRHQIT